MPSTEATSGATTLPRTVRPTKYRLTLQPNIDDFTFKGSQSVDIEILEPTSQIVLNAIDLEFGATVLRRDGTATGCRSVSLDEESQTAIESIYRTDEPATCATWASRWDA